MALYTSLHSVYLHQVHLCSKFIGSFPFDYLETELNLAGEYIFLCQIIREIFVLAQYASLLSEEFP